MILLPLLLLAIELLLPILRLLLLQSYSLSLTLLLLVCFSLLSQVWKLFDFGLVQSIDNGILSDWNMDFLDHLLIMERDLSSGHGSVFSEVGPWRVNDRYIVLFVS